MKQLDKPQTPQARFSEDYKFVSACAHCGKPMASMSISTIDRAPYPGSPFERMDVFKVWIDPRHECNYLTIKETPQESG